MNRPLFRARNLDPSKRIRLLVDQHDNNNNDLINSSTQPSSSSSSNNLLASLSSTSTTNQTIQQQSTGSTSQLPQRCVPQMPFVSGMEREEEAEYHLQSALDAQCRLGSAKIHAVPIPNLYEDQDSKTIYPDNVELPKQLIRLQPLQLESDEPEYDMDEIDHNWFNKTVRNLCPNLTHIEYETIIDKFENASTRTFVSLDEARTLFASSIPSITNDLHIKIVYDFWHERRTTLRDKRLKPRLLTERDIKEEKGKHHPYVAFRRRVEKMTTRKNRKNDEQAYMSMLKLRSSFEAVVKLTNLIKLRETTKASWLECALAVFQARCESKPDDETLPTNPSSNSSSSTNHHHHHARSHLKTSSLMNSNNNMISTHHQQLLSQLIRIENQKKNQLSTSTLASLLQSPLQSRSLTPDINDPFQQKIKRFKASHKKTNHTDKLTQLLSSPTTPLSPNVHNMGLSSPSIPPQSILERLTSSHVVYSSSQQQQQPGRRRLKNSLSGTIKQGKNHRNLSSADLWSLAENTPGGAILLKAQLLEAARKLQQKEELENNMNRRVILQDGSSVLSNTNENLNNRLDEIGTSIDDEQTIDPWQFRPKHGCRYLRPIDEDQQQRVPSQRSSFSSFHSLACSERGHLGKRRIRIGRGGRLLYDRHIEQENDDSIDTTVKSHFTEKPVLWYLSSQPSLTESYDLHSHLTVDNHTRLLAHHYQSKSSNSIYLDDSFYHVNNSLLSNTGGKYKPTEPIELDHTYSCSSDRINQALRTLILPQPPSPSTSPPLPTSLPSTNPISTSQQMMLISTPPTPPPSSSMINNNEIDSSQQQQQQQPFYSKSSSTYVLSPSTTYFPSHHHSHVVPSTPPPPPSPSSCALVQFVQLHRILPTTKNHNFTSSTPVTTSDS